MNKGLTIHEKVYLNRVNLFFGQAVGNITRVLLGSILMGIVLRSSGTSLVLIGGWLAALIVAGVLTFVVDLGFKRAEVDISNARSWLIKRILAGSLVGLMCGITPFLVAPGAGVVPELFLFILLSTLVSVASVGFSTVPAYYLLLDVIVLGPITINFLRSTDTIHMVMLATSVIWQAVVLKKAFSVSRSTIDSLYNHEQLQEEIEERLKAEEALRESEERFKILSDATFEGIIVTEKGRIIDANQRFSEITGYSDEELIGRNVFEMLSPEYVDIVRKNIAAGYDLPYEVVGNKKDSEQIILEVRGKNLADKGKDIRVSAVQDVTRRRQIEKELELLASTDSLTGIANRRSGIMFLEKQLSLAKRKGSSLSICFIDVDDLKTVNDKYGHDIGDDLIKSAGRILSNALRESDLVCRLGGDEFLLVLPDCDMRGASEIWNRVRAELDRFNYVSEKPYRICLSHGFAGYNPDHDLSADDLISQADDEMYKDKNARKGAKGCS